MSDVIDFLAAFYIKIILHGDMTLHQPHEVLFSGKILSRVGVTIDGVWIGDSIY
jgi:hypothetical protein